MSIVIQPQPGDKVITMHAIFKGDKQITRWQRNKQKAHAAFRRSGEYSIFKTTPREHSTYSVRHQNFIHRNNRLDLLPDSGATSATPSEQAVGSQSGVSSVGLAASNRVSTDKTPSQLAAEFVREFSGTSKGPAP